MAELQPSPSGMIYISNLGHFNSSDRCFFFVLVHVELSILLELGISESGVGTSPILTLSSPPTSVEVTSSLITGSPPPIYTSSSPAASVIMTSSQVISGI